MVVPEPKDKTPTLTVIDRVYLSKSKRTEDPFVLKAKVHIDATREEYLGWLNTASEVLAALPAAIKEERRRLRKRKVTVHVCSIDSSDCADPEAFNESERAPKPTNLIGVTGILHDVLDRMGMNPRIVYVRVHHDRWYDLVITAD